ncbi:MAG TPA: exodeoxyribonuclease III [Gammaproteobacteria bacterium]|nr:exodeoxyribonuclease III [Gammaproteobacteria bacterium]
MLRIISANVNGIRSAAKKNFFSWLSKQNTDIICLQETRAEVHLLTDPVFFPQGYYTYFCSAEKKGYSGVAIYTRIKPDQVHQDGLGWKEADTEGRYIQADFKNLSVASIYFPSGTSGEARQAIKYDFMAQYEKKLRAQLKKGREYILCGDWNIAHKNIDIKNWRTNQKTSGFLPEERAWLDKVFDTIGYVDAFRVVNQEPDQYTWWSQRSPTARENNVGWRIDYHVVTPGLIKKILSAHIYKEEFFSDHAPLIIDYDLTLK